MAYIRSELQYCVVKRPTGVERGADPEALARGGARRSVRPEAGVGFLGRAH